MQRAVLFSTFFTSASLALVVAGTAYATGGRVAIEILSPAPGTFESIPPVTIRVAQDDVLEIDIESYLSEDGTRVTPYQYRGTSIVAPGTRDVPSGSVAASTGSLVNIVDSYPMSLPTGVYGERILATVLVASLPSPYEIAGYRYFEVTSGGQVVSLTADEYSDRVEPAATLGNGGRLVRPTGSRPLTEPRNGPPTNFAVRIN